MPNISLLVPSDHPQEKHTKQREHTTLPASSPRLHLCDATTHLNAPISPLSFSLAPHDWDQYTSLHSALCKNTISARTHPVTQLPTYTTILFRYICRRRDIVVAGVGHGFIQGIYPREYNSVFWLEYISV